MQHGPHRVVVQYALGWPRPHIEHITIARTGWNADAEEAPPDIAYASARAFFFIAQLLVPLCQRASDSDGVSQNVRLTGGRGVNASQRNLWRACHWSSWSLTDRLRCIWHLLGLSNRDANPRCWDTHQEFTWCSWIKTCSDDLRLVAMIEGFKHV